MAAYRTACPVHVATQTSPPKLTVSSHLFARWRCCSGITISFIFICLVPPVLACWLFKTSETTFNLLTFKVLSESCVTWATSVPILVFLDLPVLELGPMYATNRQDRRQTKASLNASTLWRRRHNNDCKASDCKQAANAAKVSQQLCRLLITRSLRVWRCAVDQRKTFSAQTPMSASCA